MKNIALFAFMLFWVLVAFLAGVHVGVQTGKDAAREDIKRHSLYWINYHKDNLKRQIADHADVESMGWAKAEAKFRNQEIGQMRSYGRVLEEVTRK